MATNKFFLEHDLEKDIRRTVDEWVRDGLVVDSVVGSMRIASDISSLASRLTRHVEALFVNS